jgi:LmbE family N-acetylglucosaminyl deacetylase
MRENSKIFTDPDEVFQGVVVVAVPHMDDEVLACGGTIARLTDKSRIHLIYATDGTRSPAPVLPWIDSASPALGAMRVAESRAALNILGVPDENLYFLGFPEARLRNHMAAFGRALIALVKHIKPDHIIAPFRFDRHPDHLVVNRVLTAAVYHDYYRAELTEFFVYYRWRLLRGGDVRKYIDPKHLIAIDIAVESARKRRALECFTSQTIKLYSWQDRPILPKASLDEVCANPERFLRYNPAFPGTSIFTKAHTWIRLVHAIETPLKKQKDRVLALLYRGRHRNAATAQ